MADYRCSFCGKRQDQVKKLITGGAARGVFICDECVTLCKQIVDDDAVDLQLEVQERREPRT